MATVWDHLSGEELEERFVGCEDASASRHFQVIWLLARGHTISQVSGTTAYGERWIEQLLARYNAEGPVALGDLRRRNGAPATILKPDLLAKLRLRLDDPPPPMRAAVCAMDFSTRPTRRAASGRTPLTDRPPTRSSWKGTASSAMSIVRGRRGARCRKRSGAPTTPNRKSAALNIANTAPVVHVRQNPARKPIETAQPRSRVALIEASIFNRKISPQFGEFLS